LPAKSPAKAGLFPYSGAIVCASSACWHKQLSYFLVCQGKQMTTIQRARRLVFRGALIACLMGLAACHTVWPAGKFNLSGSREFVNEMSGHACQILHIGTRNFGWVDNAKASNVGVIAQTCDVDVSSQWALDGGALALGSHQQLGYLGDWKIFPWHGTQVSPLLLKGLSGFSSPAFCGDFVAYWDTSDTLANKPIMRVSLLATGVTLHQQQSNTSS
jgi:hypothetical protein